MQEKSVSEAINYRRSVRVFDENKLLDTEKVRQCIQQAVLAPNSSNMQLWEFYHITSTTIKNKMIPLCFNQNAAKTAQQLLVVVVRKDLWKKRVKDNLKHIDTLFTPKPKSEKSRREKVIRNYYEKLIPITYVDFLGVFGWIKYFTFTTVGLFRPMYREVRAKDIRVVAHKSAGLAAQTFMLSMAAINYDTCPMEGTDTLRIKRLLNLPFGAEINMVIGCGIRKPEGVYGERFRIPFSEVCKEI
ncbi:MAG TPA: nitroreductase family protein [Flavobacteriaceae bacterium]|jgi:nitroreductase|nr:nitroreductase family protein [Flavobacteriaceae bacterium]HBS11432.1 nitroreductase family protein [Flavobacteriaceae bacterium]